MCAKLTTCDTCIHTMADYWKSQARKYCDFCKCWIADNKPSVEFHEKGRRHKENVAKRLKFITKKSRREEHENLKVDAALAQMESAALEAYRKDVENNADLTSRAINQTLQDKNLQISSISKGKVWREAVADGGQTYYWNVLTNESKWEAPTEGFLKVAEQEDEHSKQLWKDYQKKQIAATKLRIELDKKDKHEERAAAAREKMKERRVEPIEPVISAPIIEAKNEPYGTWKTVQVSEVEEEEIPLEDDEPSEIPEELVRREFKEKTVDSLGSKNVKFKKRKFSSSLKKNSRVRLDDD